MKQNNNDYEKKFPSHKAILESIKSDLAPIDFYTRSGLQSGEKLHSKHYQIITIEEVLATAKKKNYPLCMRNEGLYCFNGAHWKQIPYNDLRRFLGECAEKLGVNYYDANSYKFRHELILQFYSTAFLEISMKEEQDVLINLQNGTFVINEKAQYLRNFDPADFITYQLPFAYDPNAKAPKFEEYLNQVLPDPERQLVLQEYNGYVFVKNSKLKLEKTAILYGTGANGKSVYFDICNAMLGSENVCNYSLSSLTDEKGYHRANLVDKLLNYASEMSSNLDESKFKQLTSGEEIEARRPYRDSFQMKNYARFMFNTNVLPKKVEMTDAFFRRFILINFEVTIPEEQRNPKLAQDIIETELPGVFNWMLEGLRRLLNEKKFTESKAINNALREFRQESDNVYLFLDEEGYAPDTKNNVSLKSLYNDYDNFCESSGLRPCSRFTFSSRLKILGYEVKRQSQGYIVFTKKKERVF